MKRDMLCITDIFRKLEKLKYEGETAPAKFEVKGYSESKLKYHVELLKDADFIKTGINQQNQELPIRLTWKGHEYVSQTIDSTMTILKEGVDVAEDLIS